MNEMMNTVNEGFTTAKTAIDSGLVTARGAFDTGITAAKGNVFNFFNSERITTRKNLLTFGAIVFMLGIIIGFVFAPIKKGFYFNISNNGNGAADEDENA